MPADLVTCLRAVAHAAFEPEPVRFAYLFGSRADGGGRPDSDVDVAVLIDDGVPAAEAERIAVRCTERMAAGSELADIELVVLNDVPLRFAGRVLRQRVVIFSRDEPGRVEWESLTGRMADDVEVWAARMDREVLAAIAEGRR